MGVEEWGVAQVCEWVQSIGMGVYRPLFLSHHVDGDLLLVLTDGDLEEIGIDSSLHRKRILRKRDKLASKTPHASSEKSFSMDRDTVSGSVEAVKLGKEITPSEAERLFALGSPEEKFEPGELCAWHDEEIMFYRKGKIVRFKFESEKKQVYEVLIDSERVQEFEAVDLLKFSSCLFASIQWQPGRIIGEGAFGVVYEGINLESGERIAVKEIKLESKALLEQFNMSLRRLKTECELLRSLSHPNIVRFLGAHWDSDISILHLFMELVPGGSVSSKSKSVQI
jgi:hypothetical protein